MRVFFADTGYWVALLNPRDEIHYKASELSKSLNPVHMVFSNDIGQIIFINLLNFYQLRFHY